MSFYLVDNSILHQLLRIDTYMCPFIFQGVLIFRYANKPQSRQANILKGIR